MAHSSSLCRHSLQRKIKILLSSPAIIFFLFRFQQRPGSHCFIYIWLMLMLYLVSLLGPTAGALGYTADPMMSRARPVSQLSEDRDFACVFENDGGTTITWDKRTTRCRVRQTISEVTFWVGTYLGCLRVGMCSTRECALCVLAPACSLPRQLHRMLMSRIARSVTIFFFFLPRKTCTLCTCTYMPLAARRRQ